MGRKDRGGGEQGQWFPVPCGRDQCQALNLPPSPYLSPSTPFPSALHSALVSLLPPNCKLSLSPDCSGCENGAQACGGGPCSPRQALDTCLKGAARPGHEAQNQSLMQARSIRKAGERDRAAGGGLQSLGRRSRERDSSKPRQQHVT